MKTVTGETVGSSNLPPSARLLEIVCKKLTLKIIHELYDGICQICFKECKYEDSSRHHVMPSSKGGHSVIQNLVLAHKWCNNRMADDDGWVWVTKTEKRKKLLLKLGSPQAVIGFLAPYPKKEYDEST